MARGKYLSLEEARRMNRLDQFCKEHPSEGDKAQFDDALERMADVRSSPKAGRTSPRDDDAC